MSLNRSVLVLNASFEPINVISAKRAMTLLHKRIAEPVEGTLLFIRTARKSIPLPSVIRLYEYRRIVRHAKTVSRKNIMIRDANTCQYCGVGFPATKLTLDHVIPKSRQGRESWENLVTCCHPCNNKKGNRTPKEAGMPLLKTPVPFGVHARYRMLGRDDKAWQKYLFYN